MEATGKPNLRERKKVRTRETIRQEAFRLFAESSYAETTVEQIAEAADVSPRTFFRYFAAKEELLVDDDLIPPIIEAFVAAPAQLGPIAAYRHGVATTFAGLTEEHRAQVLAAQQLMYSTPEARGLLYSHYVRLIGLISEGLAARTTSLTDPVERRIVAGAIVGVLIACADETPLPEDSLDTGLSILETRLPL